MQTLAAYKGKVRSLSFSADGAHLASIGGTVKAVSLWTLASGKSSQLPARGPKPDILAFAPAGTALALCLWSGVLVWPNPAVAPREARSYYGSRFAFRSDGTVLALLYNEYSIHATRLWFIDLAQGERAGEVITLPLYVEGLAWSPAGPVLAAIVGNTQFTNLYLVRPEDNPTTTGPFTIPAITSSPVISPDGRTLAVAAMKIIHRHEVGTGNPLPPLRGHGRMINGVAFLPDGRLLSASNDGTVRTWDGDQCVDVKDWQLDSLTALAVARDGMRAAVGSKNGTILIWDLD
jgi:WD40 repeat protein